MLRTASAELFRRAGKEARAQKQLAHNKVLAEAVEDLVRRGTGSQKSFITVA